MIFLWKLELSLNTAKYRLEWDADQGRESSNSLLDCSHIALDWGTRAARGGTSKTNLIAELAILDGDLKSLSNTPRYELHHHVHRAGMVAVVATMPRPTISAPIFVFSDAQPNHYCNAYAACI